MIIRQQENSITMEAVIMKKRILLGIVTILMAAAVTGCQTGKKADKSTAKESGETKSPLWQQPVG